MTLAKVKEQDGMLLAKVKEQDGMMLAKVKEQEGIMLANVKSQVSHISGLLQRHATDKCGIPFYNRQLLHWTASSQHRYL